MKQITEYSLTLPYGGSAGALPLLVLPLFGVALQNTTGYFTMKQNTLQNTAGDFKMKQNTADLPCYIDASTVQIVFSSPIQTRAM